MGRGTNSLYQVQVVHVDQSRITGISPADVRPFPLASVDCSLGHRLTTVSRKERQVSR